EYADSITPYAIPIASQRQITVSSEVENNVRDIVEGVSQEESAGRTRTEHADRVDAIPVPVSCNRQVTCGAKVEVDRGDDCNYSNGLRLAQKELAIAKDADISFSVAVPVTSDG